MYLELSFSLSLSLSVTLSLYLSIYLCLSLCLTLSLSLSLSLSLTVSLSLSNFGPNTTTFVIPGEIYPAEVRATCHGVSAACGKLGAATGAFFFPLVLGPAGSTQPTNSGLRTSMFLCAFIAFLGVAVTYYLTPKYGAHELEVEDSYLLLEHSFLQPTAADLAALDAAKDGKGQGLMFEVVEGVFEGYAEGEESGGGVYSDDMGVVIDDDTALATGNRDGYRGGGGGGAAAGGYQPVPTHTNR